MEELVRSAKQLFKRAIIWGDSSSRAGFPAGWHCPAADLCWQVVRMKTREGSYFSKLHPALDDVNRLEALA